MPNRLADRPPPLPGLNALWLDAEDVGLTDTDGVRYVRGRFERWASPRDIEFRTEFPRTRIGKVDTRVPTGATPPEV